MGVVVKAMQEKYRDKPHMNYRQMDARQMDFNPESFNVVVDKAMLDSILCGEGSTHNAQKMLMEVSKVLKPDGVYVVVSHGHPAYPHLLAATGVWMECEDIHGSEAHDGHDCVVVFR